MSEEITYCVRGCTYRCTSLVCAAVGDHDHEPDRRRADVGLLCQRCADRLDDAIAQIPDLWAALPGIYDTGGSGDGERISRGKITGSPALIRLDVMVLDSRDALTVFAGDGVMPVVPMVGGWAQVIEEELGLKAQSDDITGWLGVMRTWKQKVYAQPWIDELWKDLTDAHRALRAACRAPAPLGRCWGRIRNLPHGGCGRLLYAPIDGGDVVCPNEKCGRRYTGADLVKLAIQAEREGVA